MHNFHPIIITLNQNDKFLNEYFLLLEYLIDLMEIVDFFTKSIQQGVKQTDFFPP